MITVITAVIVLHETITGLAVVGIILTLAGLLISENKLALKAKRNVSLSESPTPAQPKEAGGSR